VYKLIYYTHRLLSGEFAMRTNIDIDDDLIKEAIAVTGAKTKKDVVTEALRLLVRTRQQASIKKLRGKLKWEGSLDEMRTDV
jgi:Arc/MetJ family transcription regulator